MYQEKKTDPYQLAHFAQDVINRNFLLLVKCLHFNSLPNDKIINRSRFKAFADDNLNMAKMTKFFFDRVENIAGKGENAGHQPFLPFPQCFQKVTF